MITSSFFVGSFRSNLSGRRSLLALVAAVGSVSLPSIAGATSYSWTSGTTGGNWSTNTNWTPNGVPGASSNSGADTATLNDATATRTVVYDTGASGLLTTLTLNQSSNFMNALDVQRNLTITNAVTLGASNSGQARISITPQSGSPQLTISGGLTVNAGGYVLMNTLAASSTASIVGGAFTLAGGTLDVGRGNTTSAAIQQIGTFTMSSGTLSINQGISGASNYDTRLQANGNFTATGGSIQTAGASSGTSVASLVLTGGTNSISGTATLGTGITVSLLSSTNQSFNSSVDLPGILFLRNSNATANAGTVTKTITSSSTNKNVNTLSFAIAAAGNGTRLKLGSNLTVNGGATSNLPLLNTALTTAANVTAGIDTDGNTLDLGSLTWTPNSASGGNTTWDLSSTASGGTIRAGNFSLSTPATVNVNAGLTLESVGGNSTAVVLSGGGTVSSTSTFNYSGAAATGTPATLTSTRSIGNLSVTGGGALRINSASLTAGGNLNVAKGTLDLSTNPLSVSGNVSVGSAGSGNTGAVTGGNTLTVTGGLTVINQTSSSFAPLSLPGSTGTVVVGTASTPADNGVSTAISVNLPISGTTNISRPIDLSQAAPSALPNLSPRTRLYYNDTNSTLTLGGAVTVGQSAATPGGGSARRTEIDVPNAGSRIDITGPVSVGAFSNAGFAINGTGTPANAGQVRFSNSANAFPSGFTVSNGALVLAGNAPTGTTPSVMGTGTLVTLADGATPASSAFSNPALLIDGAYTYERFVALSNAPGQTGPNSYVIGGSSTVSSAINAGILASGTWTDDRLLNLCQTTGGTFVVGSQIPAGASGKLLNVVINATKGSNAASTSSNYPYSGYAGTVVLTGANLYNGSTTVSQGILQLGDGVTGHDPSFVSTGINVASGATLDFKPFDMVSSPALSGAGAVVVDGPGTALLTSAGSNSGTVTVNGGTLKVSNTTGSATGSQSVTLNGGTLASGTVGTIAGSVISGTGAYTIAPGGAGSIGVLGVGGLSITSNATLSFADIVSTSSLDQIVDAGALGFTGTGTANVLVPTGLSDGTYPLITFVSTTLADATSFRLNDGNTPTGYSLNLGSGSLNLVVSVPEPTTAMSTLFGIAAGTLLARRKR